MALVFCAASFQFLRYMTDRQTDREDVEVEVEVVAIAAAGQCEAVAGVKQRGLMRRQRIGMEGRDAWVSSKRKTN